MTAKPPLPPLRDLPAGRLAVRTECLLAEIARDEGSAPRASRLGSLRSTVKRGRAAPALAAALTAAIVALLLVSPWEGSPSLTERARAAIGSAPVLHVVTEQPGQRFAPLVDIDTGKVVPQTRETEVWFDEGRALKKTIERLDGVVLDEVLETPQGGFTQGGPLITCAWIAAHPIEATKLRVSCNESMENGTTPRQVPEAPPTLDARLAGFVDHYRAALDSGQAEEMGRDTIDGSSVIWLRFTWPMEPRSRPPQGNAQDVAVDASTHKPVRLRNADGSWSAEVTVAETLPYDPSFFRRPQQPAPSPASGRSKETASIEFSQARALLGRAPLWLGAEWHGVRLLEVTELELTTGYGALSGVEPTISKGVRLTYGAEGGTGDRAAGRAIVISEATRCEMGLTWPCGSQVIGEGQLQSWFPRAALARIAGLHVTIQSTVPGLDPLAIARALEPTHP